jgi:serine/threonine protein kinase
VSEAHAAPPRPDDLIGRAAGAYRLVKLLGAGGMGWVFLGEHPSIGSKVAIKLLHPEKAKDAQMAGRFFNEARAVNLIGHENIVKVLDYDVTADGRYYCVMELLDGQPFSALLGEPLPPRATAPIFQQCCRALQAAHDRGIVHRDLKPDNVFLVRQGGREQFVKVLDFGIAKLGGLDGAATIPGVVMGTPAYMSPEQAAGDGHLVDPRSDIYSLGVMMFQAATGRTPFVARDESLGSILMAHLHEAPPPLRSLASGVPAEYERLVLRCLAKDPAARWQSMDQLHDALARCVSQPARKRRWPWLAAAAGLLAIPLALFVRKPLPAAPVIVARQPAPPPATPQTAAVPPTAPLVTAPPPARPAVVSKPRAARARAEPAATPSRQPPPPPEPARATPLEMVRLFLVAKPRASVEITWPEGSAQADTPSTVEVPKGARVKLVFSALGYVSQTEELDVTATRAVTAALRPR